MSKLKFSFCLLLLASAALTYFGFQSQVFYSLEYDSEIFDDLSGRNNRVFLKDGEILRNVEYYQDNVTRRQASTLNADGSTTEYRYWPSGNLREAISHYPESGSSSTRKKVQRHATFLEDGLTYASDYEYTSSGALMSSTLLGKSGESSTRLRYAQNGAVKQKEEFILRQTLPLATWFRISSRTFHANGNLAESTEAVGIFGYETKRFGADGRLLFISGLSEYGTEYKESWFFDDGKTARRKVFQSSAGTNVKTFTKSGVLVEERAWYGPVGEGMMNVKSFDSNTGRQLLEQIFMYIGGEYLPYGYTVFEDGVKTLNVLLFFNSPNDVQTVTVYHSGVGDNGEHTTVVYDKNGNVTREFRAAAGGGKKIWLHEYKSSEKVRRDLPTINPDWFALLPFELPPKLIKYDSTPYR